MTSVAPVLVFGITGLLGRAFLAQSAVPVAGPPRSECDIRSLVAVQAIIAALGPSRVINCAAYTAVDRAESEPSVAFAINAEGAEVVAIACARASVPLVHISTDYVLGPQAPVSGWTEDARPRPVNAYGASKAMGEVYVMAENPDAAILRVSGLYNRAGEGVLGSTYKLIASATTPFSVLNQTFCPTDVADVAAAALGPLGPGLWHFAGPPTTRAEIATVILKHLGRSPVLAVTDTIPGLLARRPKNSTLNTSKYRAAFGTTARPWLEGLRYILSHRPALKGT